jgi:hypothetical protein
MKPKHADDGMYCPMWRSLCVKVCHTCEFWDHIRGKNPQTGTDIDHWACTMKMQTFLSIENTLAQRQTTASIDALRKEVHEANDSGMANTMMGINAYLRKQEVPGLGHDQPSQQLIGRD